MKNLKITLGLIISLIFVGNSYAWTIASFHSDIQLNPDGSANITETITGDFSRDLGKHGIFRYIPFESKTTDRKTNYTPISQISVTNENQIPRNFQQSNKNDNIFLKIGDANKYVQAKEIYIIKYTVDRVPKSFPENNFAEFYWNVTGDDWDAIIQKASVRISLPALSSIGNTICFTGKYRRQDQNCTSKIDEFGAAIFEISRYLQQGEGFTVDYGFDRGIVQTFKLQDIPWWKDFWDRIGIFGIAVLMPLLSIGYAWNEKRKLKVDKPIIPKYEPPQGLHPTMVGTVIDGKYHKRDFTAGIIDLAIHKLLEIEKNKIEGLFVDSEEYFLKQNPVKKPFQSVVRASLYEHLFGGVLIYRKKTGEGTGIYPSKHKKKMYQIYKKIKKISRNNVFFKNKEIEISPNSKNSLIGLVIFLIQAVPYLLAFLDKSMIILIIAIVGSIAGFIFIYPIRSKEGFELAHEAKCYREFLKTAEIDQLNWAEKQDIFEKNLPYAVAFDLTDKWASVFGDTIQAPQWIHTGSINHLSRDISSITSDISRNISAPKSSSSGSGFSSGGGGGGFSGGGSGGGGGGSW